MSLDEKVAIEEAQKRLKLPAGVIPALLRSGLLGLHDGKDVSVESLEHFEKYRTQWRSDLPPRRYPTDRLPVPPDVRGEQPLFTSTQVIISPATDPKAEIDNDQAWFAHFYLRPNRFFFPSATELALVGPVPIKLTTVQTATFAGLPVAVCPDPDGRLALVEVLVPPGTSGEPYHRAYQSAIAVLRQLSFESDVPLPIAQSLLIGVPSGVIALRFPKPAKEIDFTALSLKANTLGNTELEEAKSLYWEALATNNPFYRFLTLWRIYERVTSARAKWRREHKRDVKVAQERMPDLWAWKDMAGRTFDDVRKELRVPFRNAVAHADGKGSRPRTPLTAKDVADVTTKVPLVQYIAKTVIANFEATLLSEGASGERS